MTLKERPVPGDDTQARVVRRHQEASAMPLRICQQCIDEQGMVQLRMTDLNLSADKSGNESHVHVVVVHCIYRDPH